MSKDGSEGPTEGTPLGEEASPSTGANKLTDPMVAPPKRKKKAMKKTMTDAGNASNAGGLVGGGDNELPTEREEPAAEPAAVPAKPKKKKRKLQAAMTEEPSQSSVAVEVSDPAKDDGEPKGDPDPVSKPVKKRKAVSPEKDEAKDQEDQKCSDKNASEAEAPQEAAQRSDGDGAANTDSKCLKVCAANLPSWFDKTRIWRHFQRAGDVQHVWLLWDKWSGESRGIAFITFADQASVKAAVEYDGTSLDGNVIRVNLATDKSGDDSKAEAGSVGGWAGGGGWGSQENPHYGQNKVGGKGGKGKSKGGKSKGAGGTLALADKPEGSLGLMARGLSFSVTEADLKSLFEKCGEKGPTRVRLLVDKAGASKGKAFIDFADEEALHQAVKLNETVLKGRPLRLEFTKAAGD